jgi:hypothetical protein
LRRFARGRRAAKALCTRARLEVICSYCLRAVKGHSLLGPFTFLRVSLAHQDEAVSYSDENLNHVGRVRDKMEVA